MDPKEGLKHPFFVPSKGVPLVGTFCVRVSVGKMPFATLKFSSASRKSGTKHDFGSILGLMMEVIRHYTFMSLVSGFWNEPRVQI